jgi:hypothetical protein
MPHSSSGYFLPDTYRYTPRTRTFAAAVYPPLSRIVFPAFMLMFFPALFSFVNSEDYGDWGNSCHIILNTSSGGANVSGSVTDFPVLIRLDPGNFDYFDETEPGGYDIRFTSSGGTHLDNHIERWVDNSSDLDSAWIWVKTDVTGNGSTQYIVMYWGKADATSKSNGDAVLNTANGFVGVMHLNQSSGSATDATENGFDGTANGGVTYSQSGIIGLANGFDGNRDYFDHGNNSEFQMNASDKVTISAWVKRSGAAAEGAEEGIAGKFEWTGWGYRKHIPLTRLKTVAVLLKIKKCYLGTYYYIGGYVI